MPLLANFAAWTPRMSGAFRRLLFIQIKKTNRRSVFLRVVGKRFLLIRKSRVADRAKSKAKILNVIPRAQTSRTVQLLTNYALSRRLWRRVIQLPNLTKIISSLIQLPLTSTTTPKKIKFPLEIQSTASIY